MKAMALFVLIVMTCFVLAAEAPIEKDPFFKELKKLSGGTWTMDGEHVAAESKWEVADNGTSLRGNTKIIIKAGGSMQARVTFGWDPTTKSVFYLDNHGSDTVYFGHGKRDKENLVIDFGTLVGVGKEEYRFTIKFTSADKYDAVLEVKKDGKFVPTMERTTWIRKN